MAWDDQQPPWGKKKPAGPEDLLAALLKKIKEGFDGRNTGPPGSGTGEGGGPKNPFHGLSRIAPFIAILLVLFVLMNSFYQIAPGEKGVVLRFGKYLKTADSGLNFMIPLVDRVIKVDVETVRKQEFGFRTQVPGQQTIYENKKYPKESLVLTGDKNVIDVEWIVQYKVSDPINFLFKVRNVPKAVRDVSETAMRRVLGNRDFDYALSNRDIIEAETDREMQAELDSYETGVKILTVKLQDLNPPDPVKPAFNEVNEADQDMKRLVNEAEETYNKVIPKARGSAKQLLEEAQGYAVERVNLAKGETARFSAVLKEYKRAKDVTRKRLYLETMEKILPSVKEVYVFDKAEKSVLPFIDLSKERAAAKAGKP
jgi:membrane protease subunit HflK